MILRDGVLTFLIAVSFKHFFAEDLGINADPNRPHQEKNCQVTLDLRNLFTVAYIIRLSLYNYSI